MNDPILMYGDEPIGQLYKNSKAQSTSIARVVTNPLTGDGISQGSGFMLDGKRCVALVNIATGTTMVEHTHYEYESVEEKVNGLKLYEKTISGTTTSSGAIQIMSSDDSLINYNKYTVVNIECSSASNVFAFMRGGDGVYATCFSWNSGVWTGQQNTAVTLKVRYTEKAIPVT